MSFGEFKENQKAALEFLFLASILQKVPSKCLSSLYGFSKQYSWIWLKLAAQENSSELTAQEKSRLY